MSTRATYQIKSGFSKVTLYIHHDGYFEGAAQYFRKTLDLMATSDCDLLTCFLWANGRAELTGSHESHGDTEYRYDLEKEEGEWMVTVYERRSYESDYFDKVRKTTLIQFVFEYAPTEESAMTKTKTLIQIEDNGQWTMYTGLDNGEPLSMIGIYDSSEEAVSKALDLSFKHQKQGKDSAITINTRTTKSMLLSE